MKKKHLVSLVSTIKNTLHAHSKADWDNKEIVETVAEVITKSFAKYMKTQEELERMGKTEEDFMIPPGGLNR